MKKVILLLCPWLLFVIGAPAQSTQTIQYKPDNSLFANPERGWQWTFNPNFFTNQQYPVYTEEELVSLRNKHITLVDKYYILFEFRNSSIPQSYLDNFQADMDAIRKVGLKAVVRFAYNFNANDLADAPKDRVLQHISQLKPYLQKNADVIAFMEAGFIGRWAEWHGSTNGLLGGEFLVDVNNNTREIYSALLDALPKKRMVAIRYVYQMQSILDQTDCQQDASFSYVFPEEVAFDGSPQARTGRHDDWFFGDNNNNAGTWSEQADARACQRAYLSKQSKYTPITTGETQAINSFNKTNSPIAELEQFHFASLSINPGGEGEELINHWRSNGIFDEMAKRFGYRFVLEEAVLPTQVALNEALNLSFNIKNVGFGGLYNPRKLEVVLRHVTTGKIERYDVTSTDGKQLDPRFWFRENGTMTKTISVALGDIAPGEYEVLLNLPDPEPTLSERPEYSIRLANQNTWESSTGFNKLNATVRIDTNSLTAQTYTVRARGVQGTERMALLIGGQTVESWTVSKSMQNYRYTGSETGSVRVAITNDQGVNHDLVVSKLTVDGADYLAKEQAINTGVWQNGCGGTKSEWLHCPGYIEFDIKNNGARQTYQHSKQPISQASSQVLIYPNPSQDGSFTVQSSDINNSQVSLFNLHGQRIPLTQQSEQPHQMFIQPQVALPSGLYIVRVQTSRGTVARYPLLIE